MRWLPVRRRDELVDPVVVVAENAASAPPQPKPSTKPTLTGTVSQGLGHDFIAEPSFSIFRSSARPGRRPPRSVHPDVARCAGSCVPGFVGRHEAAKRSASSRAPRASEGSTMRSKSPNVKWIQTMKYPRRGTWNATRPIVPAIRDHPVFRVRVRVALRDELDLVPDHWISRTRCVITRSCSRGSRNVTMSPTRASIGEICRATTTSPVPIVGSMLPDITVRLFAWTRFGTPTARGGRRTLPG